MFVIQRYVLMQYIRIFAITFCSLMGVYIVADIMSNLAEYIDHSQNAGGYWQGLSAYYAARIPWFFESCSRIVALLSAVLTIGWLQRHNEMTALMAAGISRWRIVSPLILATVVVSILGAFNREIALPSVREELCVSFRDLASDFGEDMTPLYDYESEVLLDGDRIVAKTGEIVKPRFELPSEWPGFGHSIRAEKATFRAASQDLPMGYLIEGLEADVSLTDLPSYVLTAPDGSSRPVVLSPRDFPVLEAKQLFLLSKLTLEQIQRGRKYLQYSSTFQLIGDLKNGSLDHGADARVLVHSRFVAPLLDMVMLFLGLPIALSPQKKGLFLSAGKSLLVISLFSMVVLTSQALGMHSLISPAFSAWLPLLLMVPVCVALSRPLEQ